MEALTIKEQKAAINASNMDEQNKNAVLQSLEIVENEYSTNSNCVITRLSGHDARLFVRFLDLKHKQITLKKEEHG